MIVYNIGNRFFDLKGDADKHRREINLPSNKIYKIEIKNRIALAAFLNAICDEDAICEVPVQVVTNAPEFVPKFIKEGWERFSNKIGASQ